MKKFKELGAELYSAEQQRRKVLLNHLLNTYNDGRKKTLFFVAVNLLELDDLENTISELDENTSNLTLKEKSAYAASLLQEAAKKENIILKLHKQKKPGKSRERSIYLKETKMEHNQKFLTIFQKSEISEPALFSPSDTTKKINN